MFRGSNSWWVESHLKSSSKQAIDKFTYSKGPINSIPLYIKFLTGLTNLEGVVAKKIPGKNFSLRPTFNDGLVYFESLSFDFVEYS